MTTIRFFMIGSWSEGMFHFKKLESFITSIENAKIQGSLGVVQAGFPVLLHSNSLNDEANSFNGLIEGQLIELKFDQTLLSLIDTFHGVKVADPSKGLFLRTEQVVIKQSGIHETAFTYVLNPKKMLSEKIKLIKTVDWKSYLKAEPPLHLKLTEQQKIYVNKLGRIKGREIVPINDLKLYRELMGLELIVDKGRRLALSKLGKEVFSYLNE